MLRDVYRICLFDQGFYRLCDPCCRHYSFFYLEKKEKPPAKALWILLAVAVLVVLPWAILIHLKEPDFWHYFFWEEHIRRFAGNCAQHQESFFITF